MCGKTYHNLSLRRPSGNFRETIIHCSKPTTRERACMEKPKLWLQKHIKEHGSDWLRESWNGTLPEYWKGLGLDKCDRDVVVACLKVWWRQVPLWLD